MVWGNHLRNLLSFRARLKEHRRHDIVKTVATSTTVGNTQEYVMGETQMTCQTEVDRARRAVSCLGREKSLRTRMMEG